MNYTDYAGNCALHYGSGNSLAIVVGWTRPELVLPHLAESKYAVLGPLCSIPGLKKLMVNLLANPAITDVAYLQGTKLDCEIAKLIDASIPDGITLHKFHTKHELYFYVNNYEQKPSSRKLVYTEIVPEAEQIEWQSAKRLWGNTIIAETAAEAWPKAMHTIMQLGQNKGQYTELYNLQIVLHNEPVVKNGYAKSIFDGHLPEGIEYTYGERVVGALPFVYGALAKARFNRQVYMPIWRLSDHKLSQPPCMVGIWLNVDLLGQLNLIATFRSHDIGSAWVKNVEQLRYLQNHIAEAFEYSLGTLTTISHSAHVYKWDYDKAPDQIAPYKLLLDDVYVVLEGDTAILYNNDGIELQRVQGTSKLDIEQKMLSNFNGLSASNWLYLGKQLA